jgi:hypothetical protein
MIIGVRTISMKLFEGIAVNVGQTQQASELASGRCHPNWRFFSILDRINKPVSVQNIFPCA